MTNWLPVSLQDCLHLHLQILHWEALQDQKERTCSCYICPAPSEGRVLLCSLGPCTALRWQRECQAGLKPTPVQHSSGRRHLSLGLPDPEPLTVQNTAEVNIT